VTHDSSDDAQPVAMLELDGVQLPVYDLAEFNAADIKRVKSFSSNFGWWQVPAQVAAAMAMPDDARAAVEWIHDTGELVLLGGVPEARKVAIDVTPAPLYAGNVREVFKTDVMPAGSRVAVLAHVKHGPRVHELLWGWHREHRQPEGWQWLIDRLARLESTATGTVTADDHLA
jgi:hypothetical protein